MAIVKSFGGQSISKPGSYSTSTVSNAGARNLSANGTLFLLGEADAGAPGDVEGIQSFSASQLPALVARYQSGPIVDAARMAVTSPSLTPGVAGADKVLVWKTNSSTQASITLNNSTAQSILTVSDPLWGFNGNSITVNVASGSSANQKIITLAQGTASENLGQNAAVAQLSIHYTGTGSAATLTIAGNTPSVKTLTTSCTGAPADNLNIILSNYTSISKLVYFINSLGTYTAVLLNTASGAAIPAADLDNVASTEIKIATPSLYRLQMELVELINGSNLASAALSSTLHAGILLNGTFGMSGGAKGASSNTDFSNGFSSSLSEDYNVALPCISQDATADILLGQTDSGSSYTIASVLAAMNSHLIFRGNVQNRKEAQGFGGFRSTTKAAAFAEANSLASYLVQLAIQDVLVVGTDGSLAWKQPHILAALMAGTRLGTEVGEPLTHKYMNASNVGSCVNPITGLPAGDFDPNLDYVSAIEKGVITVEKANGGWRIVVDNTTYGQDDSFIFNRGSVIEAAQYSVKFVRIQSELAFVGRKVANNQAQAIKTFIRGLLIQLNKASIITSSSDAPNGFVEKTFTVEIQGNTALVSLEIKPVQGQDFIFIQFTLGDITQSA